MASVPFPFSSLQSMKGTTRNLAQNTNIPQLLVDQLGALLHSPVQMNYGLLTLSGLMVGGTWPAAATAAPSATAISAFCLFNPAGSGVNLHIAKITVMLTAFTAGTTATQVGILPFTQIPTAQATTGTAKANMLIGTGNTPQAIQLVSGTTVGAVTVPIGIIASFYNDLAASDAAGTVNEETAGSLIVPPGSGIQLCGIGGTQANLTVAAAMRWAEIPV